MKFFGHERLIKPNRVQKLVVLFDQHGQNMFSATRDRGVDIFHDADNIRYLLMLEFSDLVKFSEIFVRSREKEQQIRSGMQSKFFKQLGTLNTNSVNRKD